MIYLNLVKLMNNKCKECGGKCCVGLIEVLPTDEIYNDNTLVEKKPFFSDRIMKTKVSDNHCIAQKDGKCTIYKKRPKVCRAFKVDSPCCILFFSNHVIIHSCKPCVVVEGIN